MTQITQDIPVVFLDMDDCIATTRAHYATGDWVDASAAGLLRRLCANTGARIVVISTWRSDAARCADAFKKHGLDQYLWSPITKGAGLWKDGDITNDWCVDWDNSDRSGTITRWLANHPDVQRWVILDDSYSNLNQGQLDRLVQPDMQFGMSFPDLNRAQKILRHNPASDDLKTSDYPKDYQTPRYTISNQIKLAIAAIDQGDNDSALQILSIIHDMPAAQ